MDIHKPKPWHGFREFLKEYLIIVVGVLTALAGEQLVEWTHRQHELAETREALHEEVGVNMANLSFALAEDRCFLAAMDRYAAWARGGPRAPSTVAAVHFPGFASTVWDQVKSGPVAHMPLSERLAYARFYADGENLMSLVSADRQLSGRIARDTAAGVLDRDDAKELLKDALGVQFLRIKIMNGESMLKEGARLGGRAKPRTPLAQGYLETLCGLVGMAVTS